MISTPEACRYGLTSEEKRKGVDERCVMKGRSQIRLRKEELRPKRNGR